VPDIALSDDQVKVGRAAYAAAQQAKATMSDRMGPLQKASSLLRANPDVQTGPGQQQWSDTVTGAAAMLGLNVPDNTAKYQELAKYLAQNIRSQQSGLSETDLSRLQTEASNPNPTTQSRQALQVLLANNIGVERLRVAAYDRFNAQYPNTVEAAKHDAQFRIKTADWASGQDPVAWSVDQMERPDIENYYKGLTPAGKKQFERSYYDAKKTGVVTDLW